MAKNEQAVVTVVRGKGRVVIPLAIRQKLGIGPKTKLLVYGHDDAVVMKKIKNHDVATDLKRLYSRSNRKVARYGPLSDVDVDSIIRSARQKKGKSHPHAELGHINKRR